MPTRREQIVASMTRCYPLLSGCGTFANSDWVRTLSGPPGGTAWAQVDGGEVRADLDEYIGRSAFFVGDLDRKVTRLCQRILRPGDTAFDIGANIGMVSLAMSRAVGGSGHVHAFEPNPRMQSAFDEMVARNGLVNVMLHRLALGTAEAELELRIPADNMGTASLVRHKERSDVEPVRVPVRRLDDVLNPERVGPVRLIKLDVEGFEAEVLAGAGDWITSRRPDAILFELNERQMPQLRDEPVIAALRGSGYALYCLPKSLFTLTLTALDVERDDSVVSNDILALAADERLDAFRPLLHLPS